MKMSMNWFKVAMLVLGVFWLLPSNAYSQSPPTPSNDNSLILAPIGNKTVNEFEMLNFTAQIVNTDDGEDNDKDKDGKDKDSEFLFSLINAPEGASINAKTGEFSWTPTEEQGPGDYSFTIRVTFGDEDKFDEEIITVTVNEVSASSPSGGNASAAASGISGYSQSFATPDEGGVINLPKSGSEIRLNVPRGAVSGNTLFSITSAPLETYGKPDPANGLIKAGDLIFEIAAASGNIPVTSFLKPLLIEFHYQESDISGLDENALAIYYWDKTAGAWIALPSRVDAENNIVSASVEHLTVFSLMSRAKPPTKTAEIVSSKDAETVVKTSAAIKPIKPKLEATVVNQPALAPVPKIKENAFVWALIGSIYNYFMTFFRF